MEPKENYHVPAARETESGHDEEAVTAALREAAARIDTLFEQHGNISYMPSDNPEDHTPMVVGERSNVYVERTLNPDDDTSAYSISYVEGVVPRQPVDTGKAGYDPYDYKRVSVEWKLDANGNPVEQSYDTKYNPHTAALEENIERGDVLVKAWGDERKSGIADDTTALAALEDANNMVTEAEAAGKLNLVDEALARVEKQEAPQEQPAGRFRAFGHRVTGLLKK